MNVIYLARCWLARRAQRRHIRLQHHRLVDLRVKLAEAREFHAKYQAQVEVWTGFTSGHHTSHDREKLASAKASLYQYNVRIETLLAELKQHRARMVLDGLFDPTFMVGNMTRERWRGLMSVTGGRLTPEELAQGWHFCPDWDDLLVHPDMPESRACTCTEQHAS